MPTPLYDSLLSSITYCNRNVANVDFINMSIVVWNRHISILKQQFPESISVHLFAMNYDDTYDWTSAEGLSLLSRFRAYELISRMLWKMDRRLTSYTEFKYPPPVGGT